MMWRSRTSAGSRITGRVANLGPEPGDALVLDDSGLGLLAADFPNPHRRMSRITDPCTEILPGLRGPRCPVMGTMGVVPAKPGASSIVPPRHPALSSLGDPIGPGGWRGVPHGHPGTAATRRVGLF